MKPREKRKAAELGWQRGEILDAALEVFAAKGYEGTSMNAIAEASGFSVGHIYNVIGNKEALYDAVMMREGKELMDLVDDIVESGRRLPAAECIDGLIEAVLGFFDSHRSLFQIYMNEAGGARVNIERRFAAPLAEMKRQTDAAVRKLFARAAAEGVTAELSAADMTVALSELINGFITAWSTSGYRGRITGKAGVIKRILWKGISR